MTTREFVKPGWPHWAEELSAALGVIACAGPVAGGDINEAWRVELVDGRSVFVKSHASPPPGMYAAEAGLGAAIEVDSAGTGAYHVGELPDERSRVAAGRRGIELTHRARQFAAADLDRFDLVVAMDGDNLSRLDRLRRLAGGRARPPIVLLRSFDPTAAPGAEVPDPWSGGDDGFEQVLDQCERACAGLLAHVREQLR